MIKYKTAHSFIICLLMTVVLQAREWRVFQIPNAAKFSCNTCHTGGGGTPRNDFGRLVEKSFLVNDKGQLNANWGPLLASLDADNDGVTNGEELQDPYGMWKEGQQAPGIFSLVTAPGQSDANPLSSLTVNFSGMSPHIGEMLYLRLYDRTNMQEAGRVSSVISQNFSLNLNLVIVGHSYYIDFFADHNGNGLYDAPPVDHAWRMELPRAVGNDVVEFTHNTNFTDIDWPYMLTINFSGMTPHLGELLEIRVTDALTSEEITRKRIESVPASDFSVDLPGLKLNGEYNVEMYADHNKNGLYDAPPTDHAWKFNFTDNTGDFASTFIHNTNFTDINWQYLLTLNLIGMTPHLGEKLFMRVADTGNSKEIGRKSVIIPSVDFSITVPKIDIGHSYNIDFFADHNGNGIYDAPPSDHAWRISFANTSGNVVQNFTHNTNFTDINWPDLTDVFENETTKIPADFSLAQNYPNPFNPETKIEFAVPEAADVLIGIFDINGREVRTIVNRYLEPGSYSVNFNAESLNSGVYFYRISAGKYSRVKKMILIK